MAEFKDNIEDIDNESLIDDVSDDEPDDDLVDGITTVKNSKTKKKPIKIKNDDDDDDDEPDADADDDDDDDEPDDDDDDDEPDDQIIDESAPEPIPSNNFDDELSINFDNFDNDTDSDDDDENFLQKFDDINKNNIVDTFHPELICHNNDEIDILSCVQRDKYNNIIDPLHKTFPFITKYEIARVIGERSKQIESGASIYTDIDDNTIDSYLIALKEFNEKKIPFIIKRPIPNGSCEYWKLQDLEILV